MTVTLNFPTRGTANPDSKATTGREANAQAMADAINALVLGSVTASDFFSANVQSSGANITLTTTANVQVITMTATGKYLRLPDCTAEATVFDGGGYMIINAGSTYSFDLQDSAATVLYTLDPGERITLINKTDATAAGTWEVIAHSPFAVSNVLANQLFS